MFRGDLDWITMKALEKDRSRRYETANGLARDIQRYLSDQPVEACPPTVAYRFRKFARRNRAALGTAAIVALALVGGIVISTWQAVARRSLRKQPTTESAKPTKRRIRPKSNAMSWQPSIRPCVVRTTSAI